ncbi:MAG: phosphatidate cytidylyltransferase [Clostridiaceae bacterium]|nr:phosphatidate cytidylyltransferase [Clostridiaceae bacterium]
MKTRIISGAIAAAALYFIMLLPPYVMGLTVFAVSIIALYEFYQCVRKVDFNPIRIVGFFACIMFLLYLTYKTFLIDSSIALFKNISQVIFQQNMFYLFVYLSIVYLLLQMVFHRKSFNLNDIAVTFLGIVYIPFLLSFLFQVRFLENGFEFVWLIFVGTFSTDICAYFIGKFFGRSKIIPKISPNKTVEGTIGGAVGSVVFTTLYGVLYINGYEELNIAVYHFIALGIICGTISQLGDWSASAIKRNVGIKDFGHIIPGHGGLLDRIDSLLFVAPAVYFYIQFLL